MHRFLSQATGFRAQEPFLIVIKPESKDVVVEPRACIRILGEKSNLMKLHPVPFRLPNGLDLSCSARTFACFSIIPHQFYHM